jgi:phosphatidylserine synthase
VLRLARFNLENTPDGTSHKRFKGLPSPGAAGCVATLAILRSGMPCDWTGFHPEVVHGLVKVWAPVGGLVLALLMVSRVPYPHLTNQMLRGRRRFSYLVNILLGLFIVVLTRELALTLLFWGYALSMPLRYLIIRRLRPNRVPAAVTGIHHGGRR